MNIFVKKFKSVRAFLEKYERHLSSLALVCGFTFDYFTLTRIDQLYDNLVFIFYLSVVIFIILFLNIYEAGFLRGKTFNFFHSLAPIVMQFAFGGLFSGFSIFYSRSTSLAENGLFLLILLGLLLGNEFFREKYRRLAFQIAVLFFALFSYTIFSVPIVVGKISVWVFLLSGLISLILISLVISGIYIIAREKFVKVRGYIFVSVGIIFVVINLFYFLNIIPPIPLSLKDSGVYHSVYRNASGDYTVNYETKKWYEYFLPYQIHRVPAGGSVFVFGSVFSPVKFETAIVHHWQYFDETKKRWISLGRIEFLTVGGRDSGYRGYSQKSAVLPGRWRVDIETKRGQIIGRVLFEVKRVFETPELKEKVI